MAEVYEVARTAPPDLEDPRKYVRVRSVPVFDENCRYRRVVKEDGTSEIVEQCVDRKRLETICHNSREREKEGNYGLLFLGHTEEEKPEHEQPIHLGYIKNYRIGILKEQNNKPVILVDYYIKKKYDGILDDYPRRSAEVIGKMTDLGFIDSVAILKRTPFRSLGLVTHNLVDFDFEIDREEFIVDRNEYMCSCKTKTSDKEVFTMSGADDGITLSEASCERISAAILKGFRGMSSQSPKPEKSEMSDEIPEEDVEQNGIAASAALGALSGAEPGLRQAARAATPGLKSAAVGAAAGAVEGALERNEAGNGTPASQTSVPTAFNEVPTMAGETKTIDPDVETYRQKYEETHGLYTKSLVTQLELTRDNDRLKAENHSLKTKLADEVDRNRAMQRDVILSDLHNDGYVFDLDKYKLKVKGKDDEYFDDIVDMIKENFKHETRDDMTGDLGRMIDVGGGSRERRPVREKPLEQEVDRNRNTRVPEEGDESDVRAMEKFMRGKQINDPHEAVEAWLQHKSEMKAARNGSR